MNSFLTFFSCYSSVGRMGGMQEIGIGYFFYCNYHVIMHEILHAAGFWHEQSRSDRDQYVKVNFHNIMPGS